MIPDVVPKALCERSAAALCEFIGVDPEVPDTWHNYVTHGHGIIPLHHHQALWDVRQLPALHRIFSVIYETEKLWVSFDRGSFKVPSSFHESGYRMDAAHWDGDPRAPNELAVQGLVYLTDTPPKKARSRWCRSCTQRSMNGSRSAAPTTKRADRTSRTTRSSRSAAPQGSLVIWHRRMAHTSLANNSTEPRLVQYVTMTPAGSEESRLRNARECLEKHPPAWAVRQKVRGQLDPEPGPPPQLTDLGSRLAGIEPW